MALASVNQWHNEDEKCYKEQAMFLDRVTQKIDQGLIVSALRMVSHKQ